MPEDRPERDTKPGRRPLTVADSEEYKDAVEADRRYLATMHEQWLALAERLRAEHEAAAQAAMKREEALRVVEAIDAVMAALERAEHREPPKLSDLLDLVEDSE
jgi:hypothetical protein